MAAGAQSLRFVAAVVCSLGVTSAVAGPMAWQAVEYRRDQADAAVVVVEEGPNDVGVSAEVATEPAARTVTTGSAPAVTTTAPVATTTTTSEAPGPPPTVAEAVPSTVPPPAPSLAPATPVTPTPTAPPTSAPAPTDTAPEQPAPTTTSAPTPTTRPGGLDEFDPRAACEDRAHELGVEVPPDCPPR
jgi:hypothetical protein